MSKKSTFFCFLFLIFLKNNFFAQCLSGTYTIGGQGASYSTVTAAINALSANGICGPVVFNIRDSTYGEQLTIPPIPGSSSINTITFKAQSGILSSVSIAWPSSTSVSSNYVLKLNGASHLIIRDIQFNRTGSYSNAGVIELSSGASNILFENCYFSNQYSSQTGTSGMLVYQDISSHDSLRFTFNYFYKGSYALYLDGSTTNQQAGCVFSNNSFISQSVGGIFLQYHTAPEINKNYFQANGGSAYTSISIAQCNGPIKVEKNNMITDYGSGITISNCTSSQNFHSLISNNMISSTYGTLSGSSILLSNATYLDLYHNSVYNNSSFSGKCLWVNGGSGIFILNNCLFGGGQVIDISTPNAINRCNFNNLFPNAQTDGFVWNGSAADNLLSWQSLSQLDSNSVSVNPSYFSNQDLHINSLFDLKGKGTPVAEVTTDIDNDPRDTSAPDIGADEFILFSRNVKMLEITNPKFPICAGYEPVLVRFRNSGSDTLTSLLFKGIINNDSLPLLQWSGLLAPGDTSAPYITGNYDFKSGNIYSLKLWSFLPNGNPDQWISDDTLAFVNVKTRMDKDYTIGGSNPDYATFSAAVADLNLRGVCAPVNFLVSRGTYIEKITITEFPGASDTNRVTFRSALNDTSIVLITSPSASSSASNFTIRLNGADYVSFKGLTIERSQVSWTSYGRVVLIDNGSKNNIFENNLIRGTADNSQAGNDDMALVTLETNQPDVEFNDSNEFNRNQFKYGTWAILANRNTFSSPETGLKITDNIFSNQSKYVIQAKNQQGAEISGNNISSVRDTISTPSYGISLEYCGENMNVYANYIAMIKATGIYSGNCSGTLQQPVTISRNFISTTGIGFSSSAGTNVHYYHNSINILPGQTANVFAINGGSGIRLFNNIFSNASGGKIFGTTPSGITSNFNCFYTSGSAFSNSYTSFTSWQNTGQDVNSFFYNPVFYSSRDLHTFGNTMLDGAATLLPGEIYDIDTEPRDSVSPDIGADEFPSSPEFDAGVISVDEPNNSTCHGGLKIKVSIKNFSSIPGDTLRNVFVFTSVNGSVIDSVFWKGTLAPGDTVVALLAAKYNFIYGNTYNIKSWTKLPNFSPDANISNDTIQQNYTATGMGGSYIIGSSNDDFKDFIEAKNALYSLGLCDSVLFLARDGIYRGAVPFDGNIPGSSATKTITFTSLAEDSTRVQLADSNSTGVLILNNAPYVNFKSIHIRQKHIYYSSKPCIILGVGSNYSSLSGCMISGRIDCNSSNNIISTNHVREGHIRMNSGSNNRVMNNWIYGEINDSLINMVSQTDFMVSGNYFRPLYSTGYFISIRNCQSGVVEKNFCYGLYPAYDYVYVTGIGVMNSSGTATNPIFIKNNIVVLKDINCAMFQRCIGIELTSSGFVNVYHNTVMLDTTCSQVSYNELALKVDNGNNINIMNNIFMELQEDELPNENYNIIYISNYNAIDSMDYNLYYNVTGGSRFTYTTNYQAPVSFTYWKNTTGFDLNSQWGFPQFWPDSLFKKYSSDNVTYGGSNTGFHHFNFGLLNENGLDPIKVPHWLSSVSFDIHDESRDTMNPLFGADEYRVHDNNCSVADFAYPIKFPCPGIQPVNVVLANYGKLPLNSATISWKTGNLIQPSVNWTGNLLPGDSEIVTLGTYYFQPFDSILISAWSGLPNGYADPFADFDTIRMLIRTSLEGDYTIGGSNPDFLTFTAAINELLFWGVCTNVVFHVRDGVYNEQITFYEIPGTSDSATVTFESESLDSTKATLQWIPGTYAVSWVMYFNGANHIRIKKLHLKNNYTGFSLGLCRVVLVNNMAHDLVIANNYIESSPNASGYFNYDDAVVIANDYDELPYNYDIIFSNNKIMYGYNGITVRGDVNNQAAYAERIKILDNHFFYQKSLGADLRFCRKPEVSGNYFRDSTTAVCCSSGAIDVGISADTFRIERNLIYLRKTESGILIDGNICSKSYGIVANNSVYSSGSSGSGIDLYFSSCVDVMHNTIRVPSSSIALVLNSSSSIKLQNNIIANAGTGNVIWTNNSQFSSDYNNLFTNGSVLGIYNGTNANTLSDWKTFTLKDANSFSINPSFPGPTNQRFTNYLLDNKGSPVSFINTDIEGKSRNQQVPDIGCYELTVPSAGSNDIELFVTPPADSICFDSIAFIFQIKNHGPQILSNAEIHWTLNGSPQPVHYWSGLLADSALSASDTIRYYQPPAAGNYTVTAWCEMPNNNGDTVNGNDTISFDFYLKPYDLPELGNDTFLCQGDIYYLYPGNYSAYLWSDGSSNDTLAVGYFGTYTVTVTDTGNCSYVADPVKIIFYNNPVIPFPNADTLSLCDGDSITLNAGGPYGYLWSNGDTTQYQIVNNTGFFSVTATSSKGCINSDSIFININPVPAKPVITPSDTIDICYGDSVELLCTPADQYLWNTGDISSTLLINAAGKFTVSVSNVYGCTAASDTVVVNVNSQAVFVNISGDSVFCEGDSVILSAGSGVSYLWSNGDTLPGIVVKQSDTLYVVVEYASGCPGVSDPVIITVHPLPQIPVIIDSSGMLICLSSDGTYQWYFNGTAISNATGKQYLPAQDGAYMVEFSNVQGCSAISNPFAYVAVVENRMKPLFIEAYPNPVSGKLSLCFNENMDAEIQIIIYDNSGKLVKTHAISTPSNSGEYQLDLSRLSSGVYYLEIKNAPNQVFKFRIDKL